jgi:predicted nucleic acid-binding Zn ribbon protein
MPLYTYRREDGTTFDYRQKFLDDPLTVDPETGQPVVRVIQPVGVVFKGSGFYVNDSKNASHSTISGSTKSETTEKTDSAAKPESTEKAATAEKSDKTEKTAKVESKPAATPAPMSAAAD